MHYIYYNILTCVCVCACVRELMHWLPVHKLATRCRASNVINMHWVHVEDLQKRKEVFSCDKPPSPDASDSSRLNDDLCK